MSEHNSQGGNGDDVNNTLGGYMAIYHNIEEICYGPLCGLPAIARVFLCIRHKLLRDGLGQKAIGHSFIIEKTGLTKAQVVNSAKKLEAMGVILIKLDCHETPQGRVRFFENKYELNPKMFGEELNWYKNNPTVRLYSPRKTGSYSRKGVAPGGIKSDTRGGIKSDTRVVSDLIPGRELTVSELLDKVVQKNPSSNNPNTNNPSEQTLKFESKPKEKDKKPTRTTEEHERIVREQLELMKSGNLA